MAEPCRNKFADGKRCSRPAKYIVWGKLFKPEQLGPRCVDCAHDQLGSAALSRIDQYAVYVLPDPALLTALQEEVERARRDADDEQLNEFARQQAELDASYVQTILDTYGGGEGA